MGGLIKMKMKFTFEEPQHATFAPLEKARQPMASRKYNKYRENQLARRDLGFGFVQPWWLSWVERMPSASG